MRVSQKSMGVVRLALSACCFLLHKVHIKIIIVIKYVYNEKSINSFLLILLKEVCLRSILTITSQIWKILNLNTATTRMNSEREINVLFVLRKSFSQFERCFVVSDYNNVFFHTLIVRGRLCSDVQCVDWMMTYTWNKISVVTFFEENIKKE